MKMTERNFNWLWIKEIAKNDAEARCLIKFSIEMEEEPHKFSGKSRIQHWFDRNEAPPGFYKILRELETKWYNQKSYRRRGA